MITLTPTEHRDFVAAVSILQMRGEILTRESAESVNHIASDNLEATLLLEPSAPAWSVLYEVLLELREKYPSVPFYRYRGLLFALSNEADGIGVCCFKESDIATVPDAVETPKNVPFHPTGPGRTMIRPARRA